MTAESLSRYFSGIAMKYLQEVEVNPNKSSQHELDGVATFKKILGLEKQQFVTRFLYLTDNEEDCFTSTGSMTWYDSRESSTKRSEYRFYYNTNSVMEKAAAGDLLMLGLRRDGSIITVIAEAGTTVEKQLVFLFRKPDEETGKFIISTDMSGIEAGFVERLILEQLGINTVEKVDESLLDTMIEKFRGEFPNTRIFSEFSRETLPFKNLYNPDAALIAWLEREEALFRLFEKWLLESKISHGFNSVDEFVELAKSVINRRKSRTGLSFQNHLERIFTDTGLLYSAQKITENKSKPDFVFPSIDLYHSLPNDDLVEELLTVLAPSIPARIDGDRYLQRLHGLRQNI